ncbi:MAG: DUF1800 domain-containing protein [Pseudomonadota bacterium]
MSYPRQNPVPRQYKHYRQRMSLILCAAGIVLAACSSTDKQHAHRTGTRPVPAQTTAQTALIPAPVAAPAYPPVGEYLQQAKIDPEQLLNRITWGLNSSSSQQLAVLGMDKFLDQQLRKRSAVLPAEIQSQIDNMSITQQPFDKMIFALESRREAAAKLKGTDDTLRKEYQQELTRLEREAASRSLLRAVYSPNQMQEQMAWFWMNHFNLSNKKQNLRAMLGDFEEQAIRPYALGNFRDLLRATVIHPAMLRYLDNEHNAVNRINENYARELMELHTMGVGSGYTQRDVQELARVLTGVGINLNNDIRRLRPEYQKSYLRKGLFEFNPQRHDFGDKQILGQTIRGRGFAELEEVITLLSRQPATARFVSHKLAVYFVSDTPSPALVESMAQRFLETDGDIPSVLRTMFATPEFVASLGNKFKDPMHYVVSAIRLAYDGVNLINTDPMLKWLNNMGELQNAHQTPDGYSMMESAWASPAQMTTRFDIAKTIALGSPALFKLENQEQKIRAQDLPRPNLATSDFVKKWSGNFSPTTQETLKQASTAQEWNTLFLAAPEMMRR